MKQNKIFARYFRFFTIEMFNSQLPSWFNQTWWDIPKWYSWLLLKLYILCLENKIDTSIMYPEIVNGSLKINVNWLVSTEFMVDIHTLERESYDVCSVCWMNGKYRQDINWVYCLYHYIKLKIKKLRTRLLLNFK